MPRPLRDLEAVDWSALAGAHGTSRSAEVPKQVRALTSEDEDEFDDALWGGLGAHVWHQGDIYEVTPIVVPFLVGAVDDRAVVRRGEVASLIVKIGESARRCQASKDRHERVLAQRTCRALLDDAPSIQRWWKDRDDEDLVEAGVTLAWLFAELHPPLVLHLKKSVAKTTRPPIAAELSALALLPARDEAWAVEAAADIVRDVAAPRPARVAAALLLQLSRRKAPSEVDPFVDELTAAHERVALAAVFDVPAFTFVRRAEPVTIDAQVVFAGPGLFLARTEDGRQFTVRWPSSGLQKGDAVRLSQISTLGIPLLVELYPGSVNAVCMRFDGRGIRVNSEDVVVGDVPDPWKR